ncbi:unnamed protein product [Meganyctiphanes norvegica]|uniref:Oplophorus-luciferin 2-monooxygenase non-catalytic subunit n=1 Tax=Meganyctiphanes norvegica TaxID=48144 RepID=A0AAV2QRR2_MEGNR
MNLFIQISYKLFLLLSFTQCIRCENILELAENTDKFDFEQACPDADDIYPCECIFNDWKNTMNLNCTMVEGEDELAQVFSSLPSLNFDSLVMSENRNVKILKAGVFGSVTFKELSFTWGVLEEVEAGALDGSMKTATSMEFDANHISIFPFETIEGFTNLTYLSLVRNDIAVFPIISSQSLTALIMVWNPLGNFPADAFENLPSLSFIELGYTDVVSIEPGAFSNLGELNEIELDFNLLSHLPTGAFTTSSSQLTSISLGHNQIWDVQPGAFEAVNGMRISLTKNYLTVLTEEVWRPLVEANVSLALFGNPLKCGCDLAWLVLEPELMNQVDEISQCADGVYLHDLDPGLFEDC